MRNIVFAVTLAILLSACAGTHVKEDSKPQAVSPTLAQPLSPAVPADSANASSKSAGTETVSVNPLKDPSNILSRRSVYFDFDTYEVKAEYRALLEAHAKYLADHANVNIKLEGNADDRGSHEYNLALGQKRAAAVKNVLHVMGVQDRRIETVSFGEEKPKAMGHDEISWAENRRTDIVYPGE